MVHEKNINKFNEDIATHNGYIYTTNKKLSSMLANRRISEAVRQLTDLKEKNVIDVGCGDGTYTLELAGMGPDHVLGVDAAEEAINCARKKAKGISNVSFEVVDILNIQPPEKRYDVAIIRGTLHHLHDVEGAIAKICLLAKEIIVVEQNGYNPVLKILETVSTYHIEHKEKSFRPGRLDRWFVKNGGIIIQSFYVGLVPFFCPDVITKLCNFLEPIVEKTPLLRNFVCGRYVQKIQMT